MKIIAHIHTDFPEKFGIPRQSGLISELKGKIVFEPEYRNADAIRVLEGFNYIWLFFRKTRANRDGRRRSSSLCCRDRFAGFDVRFVVAGKRLTVLEVVRL